MVFSFDTFGEKCKSESDLAPIVPAVRILLEYLRQFDFGSIQELQTCMNSAIKSLMSQPDATIGVESACELFKRYITLTHLDVDLEQLRPMLIKRGEDFLDKIITDRQKVAKRAIPFIQKSRKILVHSRSRVVRDALLLAAKTRNDFVVYITQSSPKNSGKILAKELEAGAGIDCKLIADASVAYYMKQMDLVLFGAEGIAESGGIVNTIGTFQVAVCASHFNKPVYILAESVKFMRFYPLTQQDLIDLPNTSKDGEPDIDYTPPELIRLLITDLGTLQPPAVSDELIKLYL